MVQKDKDLPPLPPEDESASSSKPDSSPPSTPRRKQSGEKSHRQQSSPSSTSSVHGWDSYMSSQSPAPSESPNSRSFLQGFLNATRFSTDSAGGPSTSFNERIKNNCQNLDSSQSPPSDSSSSTATSTMFSRFRSQKEGDDPKLRPFLLPQYTKDHSITPNLTSPHKASSSAAASVTSSTSSTRQGQEKDKKGPQRFFPFAPRPGAFSAVQVPVKQGERCTKCNSVITLHPLYKPDGELNVIGFEPGNPIVKHPKYVNGELKDVDMVWCCRINKHPWPLPAKMSSRLPRPGSHDGEEGWEKAHGIISETTKGVEGWIEKVRGQMGRGEIHGDPGLLPKKRVEIGLPIQKEGKYEKAIKEEVKEENVTLSFELPFKSEKELGKSVNKNIGGIEYGGICFDSNPEDVERKLRASTAKTINDENIKVKDDIDNLENLVFFSFIPASRSSDKENTTDVTTASKKATSHTSPSQKMGYDVDKSELQAKDTRTSQLQYIDGTLDYDLSPKSDGGVCTPTSPDRAAHMIKPPARTFTELLTSQSPESLETGGIAGSAVLDTPKLQNLTINDLSNESFTDRVIETTDSIHSTDTGNEVDIDRSSSYLTDVSDVESNSVGNGKRGSRADECDTTVSSANSSN